jgi:hypothetical protein
MPSRAELVIRGNAVGLTATSWPNDSKFEQKILYLEKNGTTYTETLGTGVLTSDATDYSAGNTLTIGNRVYTFVAALTGAKATGTLTSTGVFTGGETVTINGVTYTFRAALSNPVQAYEVLIGASAAASLDNLQSAINQGGTAHPTAVDNVGMGSTFSTGTVRHPDVIGHTNANDSQVVQAREFGTRANSFTTSSTASVNTWGATKMSGGVANVQDEILIADTAAHTLDTIKDAINNGAVYAGEGTGYSVGTKAHTQVTATTNSDTQQTVAARNAAFDNASIATTTVSTGTHYSWGAGTLASGVRGVAAVVAGGTGSSGANPLIGSAGVSGDKNLV